MPELGTDAVEKLRGVMSLSGWRDVMRPLIDKRMQTCQKMAFMLPPERPKPYSEMDDHTATSVLRGEAKGLEWVLHAFENEVAVHDFNRRQNELLGQGNGSDLPANPA